MEQIVGPVAVLSPIFQAISEMRRNGRTPRFVLLGYKEYDSLRANVLPGYPDYRIERNRETVFRLELLRVNRESFFAVVE